MNASRIAFLFTAAMVLTVPLAGFCQSDAGTDARSDAAVSDGGTRRVESPGLTNPAAAQTIAALARQLGEAQLRASTCAASLAACQARTCPAAPSGTCCQSEQTTLLVVQTNVRRLRRDIAALRAEIREVRAIAVRADGTANDALTQARAAVATNAQQDATLQEHDGRINDAQETGDAALALANSQQPIIERTARTANTALRGVNDTRVAHNGLVRVVQDGFNRMMPWIRAQGDLGFTLASGDGGLYAGGRLSIFWSPASNVLVGLSGGAGVFHARDLMPLAWDGNVLVGWKSDSDVQFLFSVGYRGIQLLADTMVNDRTVTSGDHGGGLHLRGEVHSSGRFRFGGFLDATLGEFGSAGHESGFMALTLGGVVAFDLLHPTEITQRANALPILAPVRVRRPRPRCDDENVDPEAPCDEAPTTPAPSAN
ncbi:hypothetical protein KBB85_02210 [Patescibacteria group bacterium]|nr:hypothetical protein [Patescibacteria group bacterium]